MVRGRAASQRPARCRVGAAFRLLLRRQDHGIRGLAPRLGALLASAFVALGCAGGHVEPRPARAPSPWRLVYVLGSEGALERLDDAGSEWVRACVGRCGEYVPAAGTYRVRGALATSDPFSLPPPDLGRVVLRFDEDGHVWTHVTPRGLRRPQPFVPSFVVFMR